MDLRSEDRPEVQAPLDGQAVTGTAEPPTGLLFVPEVRGQPGEDAGGGQAEGTVDQKLADVAAILRAEGWWRRSKGCNLA